MIKLDELAEHEITQTRAMHQFIQVTYKRGYAKGYKAGKRYGMRVAIFGERKPKEASDE